MKRIAQRKLLNLSLLAALILALLPATAIDPRAAVAADDAIDAVDQVSADSSEEIVYIDANGFIRVLDVQFSGKAVQWVSPEGNWRNMALGDFDNDGDMEIVTVGGGSTDGKLAIYDPVIAKGAVVPGQEINEIPWKKMYEMTLPSRPDTVVAGNFDPNVPGHEIALVRRIVAGESNDTNDTTRVIIYKQTTQLVDGSSWTQHQTRNFSDEWEKEVAANWDRSGGDELLLLAPESGKTEVYQPDQNFRRLTEYGSTERPAKDATLAQYKRTGNLELLMVREAGPPLHSFLACDIKTDTSEPDCEIGIAYGQAPRAIFAGNINGSNDDDEAIMLRRGSESLSPLIIIVGDGGDEIVQEFEDGVKLSLSDDFRTGAAGDIDGDGRDEPVILGPNKIRWYPEAHNSTANTDFNTTTDRRSIATGDLDRNGFISGPQFGASVSKIETTANFGFSSTDSFTLKNISTQDAIAFNVAADGNPTWLTFNPTSGTAPGASSSPTTISYTINAALLQPNQTYTVTVRISSPDTRVANNPFLIPMVVKVQLPPFQANPPGASAFYHPCQDPLAVRQFQFQLMGVPGTQLISAQVLGATQLAGAAELTGDIYLASNTDADTLAVVDAAGNRGELDVLAPTTVTAGDVVTYTSAVPWISSLTAPTTTLPTTLTMVIDPALREGTVNTAALLLVGSSFIPSEPVMVRSYQIALTCADDANWMPIAGRR